MNQINPDVKQSTGDRHTTTTIAWAANLPDHNQLPDKDGNLAKVVGF